MCVCVCVCVCGQRVFALPVVGVFACISVLPAPPSKPCFRPRVSHMGWYVCVGAAMLQACLGVRGDVAAAEELLWGGRKVCGCGSCCACHYPIDAR